MKKKYRIPYSQNAKTYYKEKKYAYAEYWYDQGLQRYPNNIVFLIGKANSLFKQYQYQRSYPLYHKAILKAKKIKVFQQYLSLKRKPSYTLDKFINRLLTIHKIEIEPQAVPYLLNYLNTIKHLKKEDRQFKIFVKPFQKKKYKTLEQLIDEFLFHHWYDFSFYMQFFQKLCDLKGFRFSIHYIENHVYHRYNHMRYLFHNKGLPPEIMNYIDQMSGTQFEYFIAHFFRYQGFYVQNTPKTRDKGGDLLISNQYGVTVVQIKRWKHIVGFEAIQEVHTARDLYHAQYALVITNSVFSHEARNAAIKLHIQLWDRQYLFNEIIKNYSSYQTRSIG
jgi:HJR/Mrr/RecB family endonuclease